MASKYPARKHPRTDRDVEKLLRRPAGHKRRIDKYTPPYMPAGWKLHRLQLLGTLFTPRSYPLDPDKCNTWCTFHVCLRSATQNRTFFTYDIMFDWDEQLNDDNETVSQINFRAAAKYDHNSSQDNGAELRETAVAILLTKYGYLGYRANMCGVDIHNVITNDSPK